MITQNQEKSLNALKFLCKDKEFRSRFFELIKDVEKKNEFKNSFRDDVTKYIIDDQFDNDEFVIKEIRNGLKFKFLVGLGSKVAREFLLSEPSIPEYVWEPQTTRLLLHLSKKAKNVLVGGAYFGDQTIPIAKQIENNGGIVHAFELNLAQINILKENVDLNELGNVKIVNKGLWNDGETFLDLSESDDLAFASPSNSTQLSNTITVDQYLKQENIENIDLIMLDIEGSEYNVLLGAKDRLSKETGYPNIVFEIHNSYVDWSMGLRNTKIVKYLESFGYKIYSIRDFQGNYDMQDRSIELIELEDTIIEGPKHGFNLLAIKDVSIIEDDLFTMVKNVSPKYILHKDPVIHHHQSGF